MSVFSINKALVLIDVANAIVSMYIKLQIKSMKSVKTIMRLYLGTKWFETFKDVELRLLESGKIIYNIYFFELKVYHRVY